MKKIVIFAAIAAALSLASCHKNGPDEAEPGSPVFTATINGTKTTVDASTGKVSWEITDEITVTDASAGKATYKIEKIDKTTGQATFKIKTGETPLGAGPYTATYGTVPVEAQTYVETPGKLYMTAPETSSNSFAFTVQCGLLEINLTKTGESVKSIAVTGTPTGGSGTTYTLTCTDARSIATQTAFYIAVPAGSYNKIVITDSDKKACTLTASSGIAVAANHIKPLTFEDGKLNFLPVGALKGVFSVSDNRKVHFSQGNLWYDGGKFVFETEQYKTHGYNYESGILTWGLFGWSTSGKNYGMNTSDAPDDYSGDFYDWGKAIGDGNTWRTLTTAEWQYLFGTSEKRVGKYKYGVTVYGSDYTNCVVIAPDDWDLTKNPLQKMYKFSEWPAAEAAGLVCLPAAGGRIGTFVEYSGKNGFYWSSSADGQKSAYRVSFDNEKIESKVSGNRYEGCSVRLITVSK